MKISEIMHKSVDLADPGTTIHDAAVKMRDDDVGALPVGENDRLVGMVTDRDIVVRGLARDLGGDASVREVMSETIYYCFEDEPVERACEVMAEHRVRRLPIVNRDKRLVGMLGLAEVSRASPDAAEKALQAVTESTPGEARH